MQMVLMTFRASLTGEVLESLKAAKVSYTLVEKAKGKGLTGQAPDWGLWGDNAMLLVGVPDEEINDFRTRVQAFQRTLSGEGQVPVPFHAFAIPCIQWC